MTRSGSLAFLAVAAALFVACKGSGGPAGQNSDDPMVAPDDAVPDVPEVPDKDAPKDQKDNPPDAKDAEDQASDEADVQPDNPDLPPEEGEEIPPDTPEDLPGDPEDVPIPDFPDFAIPDTVDGTIADVPDIPPQDVKDVIVVPDPGPDQPAEVSPEPVPEPVPEPIEDVAPDQTTLPEAEAIEPPDIVEPKDIAKEAEPVDPGPPPPPPAVILFNEVDCVNKDWVELYNPSTDKAVDCSGWLFTDNPKDPAEKYFLPAGSVIPPKGFLVVLQATDLTPGFSFGIKCGVDTLLLMRPDGSVADQVLPQVYPNVYTWGRLPDGTGEWQKTARTPGAPNALFVDESAGFFQLYKMPTIDLFFSQQAIDSLKAQPHVWTDAQFQYTDENGTSAVMDIGIHIKGHIGSFKPWGQKSAWKVKINWKDPEFRFRGKKKLTLNNMVQDASMIHEVISYTISRNYGVPSPRTGYAWVKVNGEDWGLYLNLDTYDDCLLDLWLPSTKHLYEAEYGLDFKPGNAPKFEIDEGDLTDVSDLADFIKVANEALDTEWWDKMSPFTDLNEMTKNWAIEEYIGHWDGYAPTINNYYTHVGEDGVFRMFMSGTDQTFSNHWAYHEGKGYIFQRCMANAECRNQFDVNVAGIVPLVDKLDLVKLAQDLSAYIDPWVQKDSKKPYSYQSHLNSVQGTINFLKSRRDETANMFGCLAQPNPDPDGDGYLCSNDCDENDPAIHPGAYDTCKDGIDQDCSGFVDDGPDCPCPELTNAGHKYLMCMKAMTWQDARKRCTSQLADMVKIDNQTEQDWVMSALKAKTGKNFDIWIGLNDQAMEGKYVWTDGKDSTYTKWASGQPNNGGDADCTKMKADGTWDDKPCPEKYPVLCEELCPDAQDKDGDGYLSCVDDCNDNDASIHPWAKEKCGDGKDQNCNGIADDPIICSSGCNDLAGTPFVACQTYHSWQESKDLCALMGGELARFNTDAEEKAALGTLVMLPGGWSADYWIGLNDMNNEGVFTWTDGSAPTFEPWAWDQPNNGNGSGWDIGPEQDCVRLYKDGTWNDSYCGDWYYVLCRW